MERTQIYLPKSQIKKLKGLAQKKKTTVSELVRDAVDIQYSVQKPLVQGKRAQETFAQAAERIGKLGERGPKDLSSRVDEYLYGEL